MRTTVLLGAALILGACLPVAQLEQGPGILGSYVVNGVDPIGTEYTGRVLIQRGADTEDIIIQWVITGAILEGRGAVDGDILEVEWETATSPRGRSTGTATYEIREDGRLVGTRTVDGAAGSGTETIYPDP